jgi:putative ABC transport system permease protein
MISIALIISGLLLILVPHFILPVDLSRAADEALFPTTFSIWIHPEIYLGFVTVIGGALSSRYKKFLYLTSLAGMSGIVNSFLLRPVSFFTHASPPLVILNQTISLRSHKYIGIVILTISAVVLLLSIYPLLIKKHEKRPLISHFHLSLASIRGKRFRSSALIISLAVVIGIFFSNILITRTMENTLKVGAERLGADLMIIPKGKIMAAERLLFKGGTERFYMNEDILRELKEFKEIERVTPHLFVKLQPSDFRFAGAVENTLIIGYDPSTDFTVAPWIRYELKKEQGPYDIVVGRLVKLYKGQKIEIPWDLLKVEKKNIRAEMTGIRFKDVYSKKELNVVASLEPTGIGYFDNAAFIPIKSAKELLVKDIKKRMREKRSKIIRKKKRRIVTDLSFGHLFASESENNEEESIFETESDYHIDTERVSVIFVKARDDVPIMELSSMIEKKIGDVSVINVKESIVTVRRQISSVMNSFLLPMLILLIMGVIIISVVFALSMGEKQRDIGVMRAMGAKKIDVFRIIINESLILSTIGGIFGILLGASLVILFKNRIMALLGFQIWPSPPAIIAVLAITTALSIAVGVVSGLYPAIRASRMEPYHAIMSFKR